MNDINDKNIFGEASLCSPPDYTNFCLDLSTSYNDTKDNDSKDNDSKDNDSKDNDSKDLKGRWLYQCSPGGQYLGVTHALQNISQHPENYLCTQPSVKNVPCSEFVSGEGKWQCLPPPFRNININNIQNSEGSSHLIFPPSLSPSLSPSLFPSLSPSIASETKIKINSVFLVLFSMGLGILLSLGFIAFVQN